MTAGINYRFCTTCGSTLYWDFVHPVTGKYARVAIAVGNFVDPTFPAPVAEVFPEDAAPLAGADPGRGPVARQALSGTASSSTNGLTTTYLRRTLSSTNQLNKERRWTTTSCHESSPLSPTRCGRQVARLAVGDATVGALADPYDVSIQAVSKHIKVLADAGLVSQSKDAQRRPCHLEAEVFDLMTKWIERYRQQAQERYERLDAVLAEMQGAITRRATNRQQGAAS